MQKYIAVIKRYIAAICREIWLSFLKIITVMLSLVQDVFLSNDKPDLYLAVQCTCRSVLPDDYLLIANKSWALRLYSRYRVFSSTTTVPDPCGSGSATLYCIVVKIKFKNKKGSYLELF